MALRRVLIKLGTWLAFIVVVVLVAVALKSFVNLALLERANPLFSAPETATFIPLDGELIAVRIWPGAASGTEAVVMVGGLSAWSGTWERTVAEQRERGATATFAAIDLPPFGYSVPNPTTPYFRHEQARRIAGVIESLGFEQVVLVGHSYGGGPLTEYALEHEERVARLVLIAPVLNIGIGKRAPLPWFMNSEWLNTAIASHVVRAEGLLLSRFQSFVHNPAVVTPELLSVYIRSFGTEGTTYRLTKWTADYLTDPLAGLASTDEARYRAFTKPVRLIWGVEDTLTPLSDGERTKQAFPAATLTVLSDIGHIPMIEDVDQFNDALAASLVD